MSSRVKGKENARARAAEMRLAQARAERRRRILAVTVALALVLVAAGGLVVAKLTKDDSTTTASSKSSPTPGTLPSSVLAAVTSVKPATFDKVGADTVSTVPKEIKAPALKADGKPKVLYIGAEYCPYCAAERWPVVVALSRFGTWSGLGPGVSSPKDVFPSTQTLSFHGAKFTSDVVAFAGWETSDTNQVALDKVPADDQKIFDTYNKPPYIEQAGGIPFINIGGTFVWSGASFDPGMLEGKSRAEIAKAINDPSSDIGKAVLGNANVITAAICKATGDKPTDVCASDGVKAGAAALKGKQK